MRFGNPKMLWLLAVTLPLLAWFLWHAWRKKQELIARFVQSRLLAQLTVGVSPWRQRLRLVLLVAAVGLILLALARPQLGFAWEEVRQRGLDIIVAIDTSRSMMATDVPPNRLARAKLAALDLQQKAKSDRLGLVAFAGTAFLQCPLTLDDDAFRQSVNLLEPGIIPQGGTALAEAIQTALKSFKEGNDNYKVLVLFTDGEDHDGGAAAAAEEAAKAGLRIFTVGVGTPEGDRLRVTDEQGRTSYVRDEDGGEVTSHLNTTLLRQIAQATQGDYLELRGARAMELLYDARLAPLPKADLDARMFRQYHERFQWPLGLAILLLLFEPLLSERRRVDRSEAIRQAGNEGLRKAVSLVALLLSSATALASSGKALHDYEAGRYKDAEREYRRLADEKPDDLRLRYNAGTAAYQAKRYEQATNELSTAALLSSDPELLKQAHYNLGNSYYRLGEQAGDPNQQMALWQGAVNHYDNTLKLDPNDPDAKFNRELVNQKLEELKRQQQQQQQQKQDQKDKKDDQQKQDQKKDSQESKEQQKSQEQDKQKNDQQRQQQPKPEASKDKSDQPDAAPKQDESQKGQDQPKPAQGQKDPKEKGDATKGEKGDQQKPTEEGQEAMAGVMTPQQAQQVLDAAKSEERPMIFVPATDPKRRNRSFKDW